MNTGHVFSQAMKYLPIYEFRRIIPTKITDGKVHDVNILDDLIPETGSFYVMDRGYFDFSRLYTLAQCLAFFVIQSKSNIKFRRIYSHPVNKSTGLRCDQTIMFTGVKSSKYYPVKLRRIRYT